MKHLYRTLSLVLLVCLASAIASANHHEEKYTYVIVHGATAGAYEWKETGQYLLDEGHTVYRVTLSGLGERKHIDAESVHLKTHIDDVVNTILFEDLHDVVLTGHSYGGVVITGVMDRIPDRIRHVMYFDAIVPEDGKSAFGERSGSRPEMNVKNGRLIPGWLNENPTNYPHNVGHPINTFTEPVSYNNPDAFKLNVTYVPFIPADQDAEERAGRDRNWKLALSRGWSVRIFPGTHVAMLEDPEGLSVLMQEAVNDSNSPVEK